MMKNSNLGKAPENCVMCSGSAKTCSIFDAFSHVDYGHAVCLQCGITFDNNVNELIDVELDEEDIQKIVSEDDYRRLFVETSKIGDSDGDVYLDFEWEDNSALKRGVVKHVVEVISRNYRSKDGIRVLDLGCGNGFTSIELAKYYSDGFITAVDPSPDVMKINGVEGIRSIQGTLDSIRFADNSFDAVVIIGNLMLHMNPETTLEEARRIVKGGGLVVVDYKNVNSSFRRLIKWLARFGLVSIVPRALVERAFVNMRFGFTRDYMRSMAKNLKLQEIECYSKPPRLLEFSNKAELQRGLKGILWRFSDLLDRLLDERAWVQMVWRK